jgi:hypothetical protein
MDTPNEVTFAYFWQAGGFGMYQVALFGVALLLTASHFAARPEERRLPYLRAMSVATLMSVLLAVVSDMSAVFWTLASWKDDSTFRATLCMGLFESLTPAALGFALLSLAWLAQALGLWRLGRALA